MGDVDAAVRMAAFDFLEQQTQIHGDALPRTVLSTGFLLEGRRVPLLGPQGIFKPAVMTDMPLSITTAPVVEGRPRPYEDQVTDDGLIAYRYRGTDPSHYENAGLRRALESQTPLIYFYGLVPGLYAGLVAGVHRAQPLRVEPEAGTATPRRTRVEPPQNPALSMSFMRLRFGLCAVRTEAM